MVVYAGYSAVVRMSGTSTAMTGEAATLVSGTTYQINNTAKRIWNPDATFIVYDGVTPVVPTSFDDLFGTVTLPSAPAGAVTITGAYLPVFEIAGAHSWSANMVQELLDSTPFKTTDTYRRKTPALKAASGDIAVYDSGLSTLTGADFSAVTFTGTGVDDMTAGGTFTGAQTLVYTVTVDLLGPPDKFFWYTNGVLQGGPIDITGLAQVLNNGVTITFASLVGHTLGDSWSFTARNLSAGQVFTDGDMKLLDFRLGDSGKFLRVWAVLESVNTTAAIDGLMESTFTWQSTSRGEGGNFSIGV